jgi:demethylmenaquinone methyltransferase / 2-methoxy-6-polyprenyl-1,4-benzoquinol methylase
MTALEATVCLDKSLSWMIFNRIYSRYDFMTHVFSFGLDQVWRRALSNAISKIPGGDVLDVATGTASVLIDLAKRNPQMGVSYGIDLSEGMLAIGLKKLKLQGLEGRIVLEYGDALNIPFPDKKFATVTMAFGIRNVARVQDALAEMYRVLKVDGKAFILEFSLPDNMLLRTIAVFYIRNIIPFIGKIILRDMEAYRYLHQSIVTFPFGEDFCQLLRNGGFHNVTATSLCFGIATIYQGNK